MTLRRKILRWTLRSVLGIALVNALLLLAVILGGAFHTSQDADCIIVPGAAVRPGRVPSDALRYRLEGALRLYEEGRAGIIIVTGGGEGDYAEGEVMAEWLVDQGVPAEAIIVEGQAMTTRENGRHVAELMRERGLETALVSSQWFHVARTRLCLRQAGVKTYAAPCGGKVLAREPWFVLREMIALPIYLTRLDELRDGD